MSDNLTPFEKCIARFVHNQDVDEEKWGVDENFVIEVFMEKRKLPSEVILATLKRLVEEGEIYTTVNEYTYRHVGRKETKAEKERHLIMEACDEKRKQEFKNAGYDSDEAVAFYREDTHWYLFGMAPMPKPVPKKDRENLEKAEGHETKFYRTFQS